MLCRFCYFGLFLLSACALLSGACQPIQAPSANLPEYAHPEALVSTEWLSTRLADPSIRILDTRDFLEVDLRSSRFASYEAGHIPGAVFVDALDDISDPNGAVPYLILQQGDFEQLMGQLGVGNATTVVVYDDSGNSIAARLWWALRYYGHEDVKLLNGGLTRWEMDGLPLETAIPTPSPVIFTAMANPKLLAKLDDVKLAIDDPNTVLIDSLWPESYSEGHIPTALNLLATDNLDAVDKTLLPADKLAQLWSKIGLEPEQPIITYCGAGYYGAFNLFALYQLGYENASLYDASLMEWWPDPSLQLETD